MSYNKSEEAGQDLNGRNNSAVISCSPLRSGLGTYSKLLYDLGFFESLVFFRKSSVSDDTGYENVIKPMPGLYSARAMLSAFGISFWKKYIQKYELAHLTSPEFFHLVRFNKNLTGTVHDLQPIDDRVSRSAYSYAFTRYMKKNYSVMGRMKGVVAISKVTAQKIREKIPDVDPVVIHQWTDNRFIFRDRKTVRDQLGIDEKTTIVLNVSSTEPRKNLEFLPRIIDNLPKDFTLLRIGQKSPLLERIDSHRFVNIESVADAIYPLYFNAADVYLSPSLREGFGRPTIEAVNSSLPVVVANIPINREILRNRKFLADPDDPGDYVSRVLQMADLDEEERKTLYSSLGNYYREERARKEYADFYEKLGGVY